LRDNFSRKIKSPSNSKRFREYKGSSSATQATKSDQVRRKIPIEHQSSSQNTPAPFPTSLHVPHLSLGSLESGQVAFKTPQGLILIKFVNHCQALSSVLDVA
jgi:hypothetical protein